MLILSISIIAIGFLTMALGLRGRIVERGSFCRRCRFDLCGLAPDSANCPECGAVLAAPKSTRPTLRRRRPIVLTLGIVLLLGGATFMGFVVSNNISRVMGVLPDRVVLTLHDLGLDAAFTEIATNRLTRITPLRSQTWDELIADAVAHQRDTAKTWDPRHGEVLYQAFTTGRLTAKHIEQYFELGFVNSVELPNEIRHGVPEIGISVFSVSNGRIAALTGSAGLLTDSVDNVWSRMEIISAGVVDPSFRYEMRSAGWTGTNIPNQYGGGGGSIAGTIKMAEFDWSALEPGQEHEFFVEYEISFARMSDDHVHYRTQQQVTQPIRILPPDAEIVALDTQPDTIALFQERMAIRLSPLRIIPKAQRMQPRANPHSIELRVMFANAPVAVTGHMFVIHAGQQYPIGKVSMTSIGTHHIGSINQTDTPPIDESTLQQWLDAGQVTIVIHPDPRLAEKTPGVDRILGVPILFEQVPVTEDDIQSSSSIGSKLNPSHTVGQPVTESANESALYDN